MHMHMHVHVPCAMCSWLMHAYIYVYAYAYVHMCMPAHSAGLHDAQVIWWVAYGTDDLAFVVGAHTHHLQEIDRRPRLAW